MTDICPRCGKPILEGQPRYTIDESHYECKERDDRQYEEARERFKGTVDRALAVISRLKKDLGQ